MPTASTESENSSRRSRTTPSHDEARKAWDARAAFGFTPHMECEGRKATDCTYSVWQYLAVRAPCLQRLRRRSTDEPCMPSNLPLARKQALPFHTKRV
uniref:SCP domain-containing protein n=1 Tax=Globodera pallida TaxID=36090 RepID=A0A183C0M3_GLOPA